MLQHPPPLELSAPLAPTKPPSKPEARPPPTALLTSDDWEMLELNAGYLEEQPLLGDLLDIS